MKKQQGSDFDYYGVKRLVNPLPKTQDQAKIKNKQTNKKENLKPKPKTTHNN